MIFRPRLAAAIIRGEKTATRRLPVDNVRSPWRTEPTLRYPPGQEFAIQHGRGTLAVARAVVTDRGLEPLGHVTPDDARREGFPTRDAFVAGWRAINGSWDPYVKVHVIEFELTVHLRHVCALCMDRPEGCHRCR